MFTHYYSKATMNTVHWTPITNVLR